jgi:hypothetical protein
MVAGKGPLHRVFAEQQSSDNYQTSILLFYLLPKKLLEIGLA